MFRSVFLVQCLSFPLTKTNIIMGGEGIGGVQWFVRNILLEINAQLLKAIKSPKTIKILFNCDRGISLVKMRQLKIQEDARLNLMEEKI